MPTINIKYLARTTHKSGSRFRSMLMLAVMLVSLSVVSCDVQVEFAREETARQHSQTIVDNLHSGHVTDYFDAKRFDTAYLGQLVSNISQKCDWKSRKAGFVGKSYHKVENGTSAVTFRYDYQYDCDGFVYLLTYQLVRGSYMLTGFHISSPEEMGPQ